jgi:alkylation response protein AidB-like acyl-CoA dehydrogenase
VISLASDQLALAERTRAAVRGLRPVIDAGQPGAVNRALVNGLGAHGVIGSLFPEEVGGTRPGPVSAVDLCLVREALARESTEADSAVAVQGLGIYPILVSGSTELKERWVRPAVRGELVAAFALTEPEAGSDPSAIQLLADRDGSGFRLTGMKVFISNAPDVDFYTLFARTGSGGTKGVTAFVVPGDAEGLEGKAVPLLSTHPVGELQLDGVFVPDTQVVGEFGRGLGLALRTLTLFRPSVGAAVIGMAQCALELSLVRASSRQQFGKRLRDFQAISHRLADMATTLEAARLLVYSAAQSVDLAAADAVPRAAMAKLFATETAQRVIDDAVQIHGAVGLKKGHPLEHLYREVRAPRIYEGTSEIQREIIARELFR